MSARDSSLPARSAHLGSGDLDGHLRCLHLERVESDGLLNGRHQLVVLEAEAPAADGDDVARGEHALLGERLVIEQRATGVGLAEILDPNLRVAISAEDSLLL